jgi:hypothetical protein
MSLSPSEFPLTIHGAKDIDYDINISIYFTYEAKEVVV